MSYKIFVNLPVADVEVATSFYAALGFERNADFSDETTSGMALDDHVHVMLLEHAQFGEFLQGTTIAPVETTEVLNALLVDNRAAVDRWVGTALGSGGSAWKDTEEAAPGMYGGSFRDPDGHVWEIFSFDG